LLTGIVFIMSSGNALATAVSGLSNLDIAGTSYDVTFHVSSTGFSFNSLFDPNGDGDFTDSTIGHAPVFWGDMTTANIAANAIISALGSTDTIAGIGSTLANGSDAFLVPFARVVGSTGLIFQAARDDLFSPGADNQFGAAFSVDQVFGTSTSVYALATFAPSASVPEPATLMLLMVGLIGLALFHGSSPDRVGSLA